MSRAEQMAAAADATVAAWSTISPEDREDLITRLIASGHIRHCDSGGYAMDLGHGPDWRSTKEALADILFGSATS